eukprot:m.192645 g.192645  ORF g.192645 m.192645 type:complete len:115 (-) comp15169_c0_seq10:355-699(-)
MSSQRTCTSGPQRQPHVAIGCPVWVEKRVLPLKDGDDVFFDSSTGGRTILSGIVKENLGRKKFRVYVNVLRRDVDLDRGKFVTRKPLDLPSIHTCRVIHVIRKPVNCQRSQSQS